MAGLIYVKLEGYLCKRMVHCTYYIRYCSGLGYTTRVIAGPVSTLKKMIVHWTKVQQPNPLDLKW
jgi:hypothetical protein